MLKKQTLPILVSVITAVLLSPGAAFSSEGQVKPLKPVPKAYANKHMPEGWWTDPTIIEKRFLRPL